MIRVDEIYDNVFTPKILEKERQSIHYFSPFGTTDFENMKVNPLIPYRDKILLCWDQEPYINEIHRETINTFVERFMVVMIRGGLLLKEVCAWWEYNKNCKVIFLTSEKNSKEVNQLCEKFNWSQSYYFFHAWASLDWYRGYNRTFLIKDYKDRKITNTFISPNRVVGGNRYHRVDLFRKMVEHKLIENNQISFPAQCPYSGEKIEIDGVKLPLVFEGEEADNIPNESYKITLWEQAKNSLLYIVTETLYEQQSLHLTEKTFKPIVMQMPFVIVGTKGSLEYLRSYGFKTFDSLWDESYDKLDNKERLDAIVNLLKTLNSLSLEEKAELQKQIAPIVEYNFNWFYSQEFENLLWEELKQAMDQW